MINTPFGRDVPADRLYASPQIDDAIGRLTYAANRYEYHTESSGQVGNGEIYRGTYGICQSKTGIVYYGAISLDE